MLLHCTMAATMSERKHASNVNKLCYCIKRLFITFDQNRLQHALSIGYINSININSARESSFKQQIKSARNKANNSCTVQRKTNNNSTYFSVSIS